MQNFRIGTGYDIHRLVESRSLILGGINIPHTHGLLGHSDADCLTHAVCDALLGAAGLRDIGHYFPDTDPRWKGADSQILLQTVIAELGGRGYTPVNIDITVIAEKPRIKARIDEMKAALSKSTG